MLPPAQLLPFAATTTDLTLLTGVFLLRGWAVVETTGSAAATFELHDGADDTTPLVAPINLATSESTRDYPPGNGILLRTGLFLEVITGSVAGTIWYTPLTHLADIDLAEGDQGPYLLHPGT